MSAQRFGQITPKELGVLETLLAGDQITNDHIRIAIRRKISGARLIFGGDMPPDVATVGSRIRFTVNGLPAEERTLTWTVDSYPTGSALHIGTLRGIALLGLSAGAKVAVASGDRIEQLQLTAILYQPEAAARKQPISNILAAHIQLKARTEENLQPKRSVGALYWDDDNDPGPSAA